MDQEQREQTQHEADCKLSQLEEMNKVRSEVFVSNPAYAMYSHSYVCAYVYRICMLQAVYPTRSATGLVVTKKVYSIAQHYNLSRVDLWVPCEVASG